MAFQIIDLLLDALGAVIGLGAYMLDLRRTEVKGSRFMQCVRQVPSWLRGLRIRQN